jgi:Ca2+-binding EF-hand superfamily protein
MKLLPLALTVAAVIGALPALAQPAVVEKYVSIEAVPKVLLADIRHGQTFRDQYIARLVEVMRTAGTDKQVLTQQDVDNYVRRNENAERRERYLQVIFYDLDYDGAITQQEVGTVMMEDRRRQKQSEEGCADDAARLVARYDTDKDGAISLKEMSTPDPAAENRGSRDKQSRRMKALLTLDPDRDGRLTMPELEALGRKAFATADTDGDGSLSRPEMQAVRDVLEDY